LCRRVTEEARALGFARAYLFTLDKQDLYRRLGWSNVEQADWRGHQVNIMANDLAG
jgi:N-acetylglutamate synthase-like GNAT family acetyltransferase